MTYLQKRMEAEKMKCIVVTVISMLAIGLSFQDSVFAQEKVSGEDKMIGATFKGLAKAYIAVTDIDKLKKDKIDELNTMDTEKFQKRYARIYVIIKDWPSALKSKYTITEAMTKDQAIKNIASLNKAAIYEMIDSTPDAIIAARYRQYLAEGKQEAPGTQKTGLAEQVTMVWNRILETFNTPAPKQKSGANDQR